MAIATYIFTGITGLEKTRRLRSLRRHILAARERILREDEPNFDSEAEKYIPIIELVHLTRGELTRELGKVFGAYQRGLETFQKKIDALKGNALTPKGIPKRLFVHTHLTNSLSGQHRSWVGVARLQSLFNKEILSVELIINMIDNIHVCRSVIHNAGFRLTLDQVITWRDTELMMTEVLAGQLFGGQNHVDQSEAVFTNAKIVAMDHCLHTVADLLLDRKKYQIYTAYPISKIRDIDRFVPILGNDLTSWKDETQISRKLNPTNDERHRDQTRADVDLILALARRYPTFADAKRSLVEQNQEFRYFFADHGSFIVFDPSTIDELPLTAKFNRNQAQTEITITRDDCWPPLCRPEMRFAAGETLPSNPAISVPAREIRELIPMEDGEAGDFHTSVGRQVRSRDLRLVEQSEGLIAYRPTLGGRWSTGVEVEINHAIGMDPVRAFFVISDNTDGDIGKKSDMAREMVKGRDYDSWNLSDPAERRKAFEYAARKIVEQIDEIRASRG
jgi:hypothetical protein